MQYFAFTHAHKPKIGPFFADSFPILFSLLFFPFFSPFLCSLSSTFYPPFYLLEKFRPQPLRKPRSGTLINYRWLGLFYHQFCTRNWTRVFWNSSARIWLMLKMETSVDGSVLPVLAAYQNNLVMSKMMTSQVVQCLLL